MSRHSVDMIGKQFGQLKILSFSHQDGGGNYHYASQCDCGNIRICQGSQLRVGKVMSCHQCQLKARQAKKIAEKEQITYEAQDMEFIVRLEEILLSMQENERALQDLAFEFRQAINERR